MVEELRHYGVKGMKWGVRKDQKYKDRPKNRLGRAAEAKKNRKKNRRERMASGRASVMDRLIEYGSRSPIDLIFRGGVQGQHRRDTARANRTAQGGATFIDGLLNRKDQLNISFIDLLMADNDGSQYGKKR